jgi:hypothetical protein
LQKEVTKMVFTKGHKIVGNRNGRPKGSKNKISQELIGEFLNAIKEVEEDKKLSEGNTFFKHIVSRAFRNDAVAIALLRKLVPDQTFNINDFRGGNVKVTFEIIDAKAGEGDKEKDTENTPDNNQDDTSETD